MTTHLPYFLPALSPITQLRAFEHAVHHAWCTANGLCTPQDPTPTHLCLLLSNFQYDDLMHHIVKWYLTMKHHWIFDCIICR